MNNSNVPPDTWVGNRPGPQLIRKPPNTVRLRPVMPLTETDKCKIVHDFGRGQSFKNIAVKYGLLTEHVELVIYEMKFVRPDRGLAA